MDSFQNTLRHWRKTRRFSQLDLALEADVSARHLSFLETGRARPSAGMIDRLSDVLTLPLDARNVLRVQAGFAPRYAERAWDDAEMAPVRSAVSRMLERHAPFPAIVVDGLWVLQQLNPPAARLFGLVGLAPGGSVLEAMLDGRLEAVIENWDTVRHHSAIRLRTESVALGGVPTLDAAAAQLLNGCVPDTPTGAVVPTIFAAGDVRLSMFGVLAEFGTPTDVALHDLRVELFHPADEATERLLHAWAD